MEKKKILKNSIKACFKEHKAKKRRALFEKVKTLYWGTYDFYLTLYLADVKKNNKVDLPAFMYISKQVICKQASEQAVNAMYENVISQGVRRINECYKSYIKFKKAI